VGKTVAVSFEEKGVKIVYATLRGGNITVEDTREITDEQFEYYLSKEKAKEFIVSCDFSESYYDIVTIPVVKPRHLKRIIETEIRKTTNIKDFSFIFTPIGERIIENRKVMEVSYFAVSNEEIRSVVKRFYENGKIVKALYPRVFAISSLLKPDEKPIICVLGTKTEKTAFLFKNGIIFFLRRFKSLTAGLSDIDIQDINMTVNYCLQNLRINPSSVLLAGNLSGSVDTATGISLPIEGFYKPEYINSSTEEFNNFIIPISSFYAHKSSNILSRDLREINVLKHYLQNASKVFVLLTLLCLIGIVFNIKGIVNTKAMLKAMRDENLNVNTMFSEYNKKEAELRQYLPLISFINESSPSIQRLLIALAGLEMGKSRFNSIYVMAKDGSFLVTLEGSTHTGTYASMHRDLEDLIDSLSAIEGVTISDKTIDIEKKRFLIRLNYRILK
jgi:hypothetical protein